MKKISNPKKRLFLIFVLLSVLSITYGQVTVQGRVVSATDDAPLPGVNIIEKGTTNGTITDFDGNFTITISGSDAILLCSSIGFLSEEIMIGDQTYVDLLLIEDISKLEQVVVIGYGGIKRKELTGAVTTVSSEELLRTPGSDLNAALQGQMAGISVQASSGAPGAQANIQIRGIGSFSAVSVTPLYVIDGIPYDGIPNITPEEIETIDVSKDGATAAIYGTRASNGVIQITTKKGQAGKLKVNYSTYYGLQNITSGIELMGTEHHIYTAHVRGRNMGLDGTSIFDFTPDALERDNDFQDYITVNNAPVKNHSITLSTGTDKSDLSVVTNYFSQDGVLRNSGYNSISTRVNGGMNGDKFSARTSMSLKMENRDHAPWGIYEQSIRQSPYFELPGDDNETVVLNSNTAFFGAFALVDSERSSSKTNDVNANINLKYELIEGLSIQVLAGAGLKNFRRSFWEPQYFILDRDENVILNSSRQDASLELRSEYTERWTAESILEYEKNIGLHNFKGQAGYSRESTDFFQEISHKQDFLSNETQVFDAGNQLIGLSGFRTEHRIEGALGRLLYNFDEKYLLSASIRYDGSSNFGVKNRHKAFWGTSFGWNISEEAFFKNIASIVSSLKIRGSVAKVGNERIPQYLYSASIHPGSNYHFGTESSYHVITGSTQRGYPNEAVQWESNFSKNVGLDASLLAGRISFTFDAYHNSKKDMLIPVELPPSSGGWLPGSDTEYSTVTKNVGNMVNKGIEFDLKYQGQVSDLKWWVQGTFAKNENKVTQLPESVGEYSIGGGAPILYTNQLENVSFIVLNEAVPTFMLIPTNGVIKDSAQLAAYEAQWNEPTGAELGDLRYVDSDGNGVKDEDDRVPMGSPVPDFEIGVNLNAEYKGIDIGVQLFYSHGAEIYNGAKAMAYQLFRHEDLYAQWAPSNPDSDVPSLRQSYTHDNYSVLTDRFLEDGTYLRIRNITLGYTLPGKWTEKVKIDRVRAYLSLQNPVTFTKYTGFDPEVGYTQDEYNGGSDALFSRGVDRGNYPVSRLNLIGLQINF